MSPVVLRPPAPEPLPGAAASEAAVPFAPDLHDAHHLRLKALLLLVWASVSFGVCYFARDLQMPIGGWPLGYWIAAQGAVLIFIGIVLFYCWAMNRLERQNPGGSGTP